MFEKQIQEMGRLRRQLIANKISADDILEKRGLFEDFAKGILKMERDGKPFEKELQDAMYLFIILCIDVYTYSESGGQLVDDPIYHAIISIWRRVTELADPFYADNVESKTSWKFAKHEAPFMVGTINKKLYSPDELEFELEQFKRYGYREIKYAPKFDGVSSAVKVVNHRPQQALTRNDGMVGQDITELVKEINAVKHIFDDMEDGYYKCELAMSTEDYNELIKLKPYANRRSATSGIVSTPSNLQYAGYVTAIPLAWSSFDGTRMRYLASHYLDDMELVVNDFRLDIVYENIERILHQIRQPTYPFRVDGVVLFPCVTEHDAPNTADLMASCLAYKVNTQEAITHVETVYMSVGRTGLAKPMARVEPCDLNETVCTDVALGSMDQFSCLNLHKGEEVIIYSAGDVIPQLKLPEPRRYNKNATRIRMDIHCPHCGKTLMFKKNDGANLYCLNTACPRVKSGMIVNFLDKLEVAEGFRDETFFMLVEKGLVRSIKDLFFMRTKEKELLDCGLGPVNTTNLLDGLDELRSKQFEVSTVIGACGIENIAIKTCKAVFRDVSLQYLLSMKDKERVYMRLLGIPGVGSVTAKTLTDWLYEYRDFIEFLLCEMNIVNDTVAYGTVCFTGFRNREYPPLFKAIGFPVVEGVTKDTVAVVYVGDTSTGNAQKAIKREIPLIHFGQIDGLLAILKKESEVIERDPQQYTPAVLVRYIKQKLL